MRRSKRLGSAIALVLLSACGGGDKAEDTRPRGPLPYSINADGSVRIGLAYYGDTGRISSITATGPGPEPGFVQTTVALTFSGSAWSAVLEFPEALGHPGAPTTYDFAITENGAIRHETGVVPCYLPPVPLFEPTSAATVTSPVKFRWDMLPGGSFEYTVYAFTGSPGGPKASVIDRDALYMTLPVGGYDANGFGYRVDAAAVGGYEPTSPNRCSSQHLGPRFTVTSGGP